MTTATRTFHALPIFIDGTVGEWLDTGIGEGMPYGIAATSGWEAVRDAGLVHVDEGGTVRMIRLGQPDCAGCQGPGDFRPGHYASSLCASGKRPHCTCRACF